MVEFGLLETTSAGGVGVFVIITGLAVLALKRNANRHAAEYGNKEDKQIEREAGVYPVAKANRKAQKQEQAEATEAKHERGSIQSAPKKNLSPSQVEAEKAAATGAHALEDGIKASQSIASIEGRNIDLDAELANEQQDFEKYVKAEEELDSVEEQQVANVNQVISGLEKDFTYSQMDSRVVSHLMALTNALAQGIAAEVQTKVREKDNMKVLLERLNTSLEKSRRILRELRTASGIFKKREVKEERDYSKGIRQVAEAIKKKKTELSNEQKRGKKADQGIIRNLEKEVKLMSGGENLLRRLEGQLSASFKRIKGDHKKGRKSLNNIKNLEKQILKFDDLAGKSEASFEAKIKMMEGTSNELSALASVSQSDRNVYRMALSLSEKLNVFFEVYKDAEENAKEVDSSLKEIIKAYYQILLWSRAYQNLIRSLNEAEKAIVEGTEVMTKVIESILVSDDKVSHSEAEVESTIAKLRNTLNYEARLEKYVERWNKVLENKVIKQFSHFEQLRQRDARILQNVKGGSQNLGTAMAQLISRKVEVDKKYMAKAQEFESQLNSKNATASRWYRRSRRLTGKARGAA